MVIITAYQIQNASCRRVYRNMGIRYSCAVCFFGVIPRSIKHTWPQTFKNIILPLREFCDVTIYVYNLDVGSAQVDGVVLDQNDCSIIPADIRETSLQADVDKIISEKCKPACQFRSDYNAVTTRNAMRQMHSEQHVAKFLRTSKHDLVVVAGPDYFFANKINLDHVSDSLSCRNCVYTSQVNDAEGYTDGFYFGRREKVICILDRFDDFVNSNHDYEYRVKQSFKKHGITRKATDIVFWKIRANGRSHWQGSQKLNYLEKNWLVRYIYISNGWETNNKEARRIRNLYRSSDYT